MERLEDMNSEIGEAIEEQPEVDPLAKAWGKRLAKAQKYWGPFFNAVSTIENLCRTSILKLSELRRLC